MGFKKALSRLIRPGIKAVMPVDKDTQRALKVAYRALERQVPQKVIDDKEFGMCPHCHNKFNSELVLEYYIEYCPRCGQALDFKGGRA